MKTPLIIAVTLGLMAPAITHARDNRQTWEYDGRSYASLEECQRAKKRAKDRGTVVGAAVAGVGAALLGGNVAETALVAGGGALVGRELGKSAKPKQC